MADKGARMADLREHGWQLDKGARMADKGARMADKEHGWQIREHGWQLDKGARMAAR